VYLSCLLIDTWKVNFRKKVDSRRFVGIGFVTKNSKAVDSIFVHGLERIEFLLYCPIVGFREREREK